ncbi:MAG: right-handed parallel beta-helix repeat-containing protein [Candidatus Heimdallarchaeota archaeon]|nr:right-handed parallel beta-helix repeat-containing protein [Candidatus Heimdallarchaeota archaeon]
MRNTLKLCFILLLFVLISNSFISSGYQHYNQPLSYSLSSEAFISINSDADFASFSIPGIGSSSNPYIIEGYTFSNSLQGGIFIGQTTKNVVIRNCSLDSLGYGISLSQIVSGKISILDTSFKDCPIGVYISETSDVDIQNNTYSLSEIHSIHISKGHNINIQNNTFEKSGDYSIFISQGSSGSLIYHNDFFDNALENDEATSQAYDDGRDNLWSNEELQDGNYWNDLGGTDIYHIDGIAGATDNNPHPGPVLVNRSYAGGGDFPFFSLVFVFVVLALVSYKLKNK